MVFEETQIKDFLSLQSDYMIEEYRKEQKEFKYLLRYGSKEILLYK